MIIRRQLGTGLVLRLGVLLLRTAIAPLTVAAFGSVANAEGTSSPPRVEPGTAPATAAAFNEAIARGDLAAARALLMPEVLIFESGDAERSADEYSRHHLPSDIEFMARIKVEQLTMTACSACSTLRIDCIAIALGTSTRRQTSGSMPSSSHNHQRRDRYLSRP